VGAVVYLIVRLGTAVPNAPANVGTYQFFTVAGLTHFSVRRARDAHLISYNRKHRRRRQAPRSNSCPLLK
jgi:hypothetical protein